MPLRICLVCYLISKQATGLSSYMQTLTAKLLDEGHEVTVLTTDLEYAGSGASEAMQLDTRARQITFPVHGKLNRRLYRCALLVRWLRSHAGEFDVLDIQGVWALVNLEAARAARKAGLPYVITPHGMLTRWDWKKRKPFKDLMYTVGGKAMLDQAAAVRFLSQGERDNSHVQVAAAVKVIPNAVTARLQGPSAEIRTQVRAQLSMQVDAPLVLFLGRISHQKGVLELVQAVEQVGSQRDDLHLIVIGPKDQDAGYADSVNAAVGSSAAASRVHLLGPVFGEEKYKFLQAADLFATLSRNEGLSLAALEALAAGLPVLLTEDANLPEVAEQGAGRIVHCEPREAAAAILDIFSDPERLQEMSRRARWLHREKFSWQAVLPQVVAMYREAVRRGRA